MKRTYVSSYRVYRRTKILRLSASVSFKNEYAADRKKTRYETIEIHMRASYRAVENQP